MQVFFILSYYHFIFSPLFSFLTYFCISELEPAYNVLDGNYECADKDTPMKGSKGDDIDLKIIFIGVPIVCLLVAAAIAISVVYSKKRYYH